MLNSLRGTLISSETLGKQGRWSIMRQKSLESLIRMANTVGATVICEYQWPKSWSSCWNWQSLTCFLNMKAPSTELRWSLQRLIFEAKTHVGWGTNRLPNALLDQPCYNLVERNRLPRCKKATQLVRIVEWLSFCAPYRQKLFSPTKPISEKCSA